MHPQNATDNDLIVSYRNGNENSLQQLIKRYEQKIFTSIIILVKEKELAEDIFQDTFIKVIKILKNGTYKEEGKFLPWVIRIAHNMAIDHFRKMKRMPLLHDSEDYSVINNLKLADDSVEERMIKTQIHNDVRALIEKLPYEQKEVVIMRHYGDMSFKEIAECTNVSINTALGRMRYALFNLRKLIKENNMVMVVK